MHKKVDKDLFATIKNLKTIKDCKERAWEQKRLGCLSGNDNTPKRRDGR
jgi:hypothetical protein